MAELIVTGFQGNHRAAEVLEQLQELNALEKIDLYDAVAVYRTKNGRLRLDQSMQPTLKQEAALGGLVGAIVGALFALPFAAFATVPAAAAALGLGGTAVGATGGAVLGFDDAATWQDKYGISEEFVKEVGGMVQAGQSAVFMLVRASDPAAAADLFRGYGGRILRTTLSPEATAKLQETLSAQTASHAH